MSNNIELTNSKKIEIKTIFIKCLLNKGKKNTALNLFNNIIYNLKKLDNTLDPYYIIYLALLKVEPLFDIRSIKIVKSVINVPIPLNHNRRLKGAIKLILDTSYNKSKTKNTDIAQLIALEFYNSFKGSSESLQKRNDIHRKAYENRSFAHFRWFN